MALIIVPTAFDAQDWLDTTHAKCIQLWMEVQGEPGYFNAEVQAVELESPDGAWDRVEYPPFFWWREEHGIKQEPPASLLPITTRCPRCWSTSVAIGYPYIICKHCGYSEPLIDYPISYSIHRSLCQQYGLPDPGSDW